MKKKFALCIDNKDNEASLISQKIYEIIPDEKAERDDLIRVIDESGEDYLHVLFSEIIRPKLPDYNNPFTFIRPIPNNRTGEQAPPG